MSTTEVTAPDPATVVGTPEYDAAMVAKGQEANGITVVTRPEHIPEKFWDAEKGEVRVEDLAKSYSELERGKAKPKDEAAKMGDDKSKDDDPKEGKSKDDGTFDMGAHREQMSEKIARGEALGDTDYAPFEKMGFKREDIDEIASALTASAANVAASLYAAVGGEDNYTSLIEWGKANYTPEEVGAYDAALQGTAAARSAAIKGLEARYKLAVGTEGSRDVTARGAGTNGAAGRFESKAEMVAAMQDPKYAKDSAYRAEVAQKVENAMKAGINIHY